MLRVSWALYAAREPFGFFAGDPLAYLYYGKELAAGHGYRSFVTHQPTAFYPIGYPLFISLEYEAAKFSLKGQERPRGGRSATVFHVGWQLGRALL